LGATIVRTDADGSLAKPFGRISDALASAASRIPVPAAGGAMINDGDRFIVDDGTNPPVVFEFDSNASTALGADVAVAFTANDDQATLAANIAAAINGVGATLLTTAAVNASNDVVLTNLRRVDISQSRGLLAAPNVVRILANPGPDGDVRTVADNAPYLVGRDDAFNSLADGRTFQVPQGVTVMIDAGVIVKSQEAVIDLGTSSQNLDRRGGALQVLGTPDNPVYFTSYEYDAIGGDSDGVTDGENPGDWGGLVFRQDSDFAGPDTDPDAPGIFLNTVNFADISYGGGQVTVDSVQSVYTPIHMIQSRPTITHNVITNSADAAISADPNSFDDSRGRIGPAIHGNTLVDNTINGLFVRIRAQAGQPLDVLDVTARFDDTDITHVITQNLLIEGAAGGMTETNEVVQIGILGTATGGTFQLTFDPDGSGPAPTFTTNPIPYSASAAAIRSALEALPNIAPGDVIVTGGPLPSKIIRIEFGGQYAGSDLGDANTPPITLAAGSTVLGGSVQVATATDGNLIVPRLAGRLQVDPGIIVKLDGARIEMERGASNLIAEGTPAASIIFTSLRNDTVGIGGTFDTSNDGATSPQPGDWGGFMFNAVSRGSFEHVWVSYGGGSDIPIEGGSDAFNVFEIHQADVRIVNSTIENNASGNASSNRNGRGTNLAATIFVRGAQPIIVNNVLRNNAGDVISINANALQGRFVRDVGPGTQGFIPYDPVNPAGANFFPQFADNRGPLIRMNRLENNGTNGMSVRPEELTTETIWDDADIVHVVRDEINLTENHHVYSGLTLASAPDASLVVKLQGPDAGFTADGDLLEIDDRIGGVLRIVGQPGFPVVLTSLRDDDYGASFDPAGFPNNDTNNDGASTGAPGDWRSVRIDRFAHDRNVVYVNEIEQATGGTDINGTPATAQFLGQLAPDQKSGDDVRKLGFEVHGYINADNPADVDVYSFTADAGTEIWIDIDRTGQALDAVVELLDAGGTVLARSITNNDLSGIALPLIRDSFLGGDYYSTNPRDPGMNLILPAAGQNPSTYFVRVRSNPPAGQIADTTAGLTSGQYQLQIRLQQVDEIPGSTVRFADIRYAQTAIEVLGQPTHSPLVGESAEASDAGNNNFGGAQELGEFLQSDRNVLSVAGSLSSEGDIDWYKLQVDIDQIQSIGGVNSGTRTFPVIFDLDYADGLGRADITLAVFDANGRLIFVGRESNVQDDQPAPGQGADLDDLSRGTVGKLDPFIGPVHLPAATPGGNQTYYVAVMSNRRLPAVLNQTYVANATASNVRLEPVNSLVRIAEDHIGYSGYTTGDLSVGAIGWVPPVYPGSPPNDGGLPDDGGLFDISNAQALETNVRPFTLADVVLYVSQIDRLRTVNAYFDASLPGGGWVTDLGTLSGDRGDVTNEFPTQDLAFRTDGRLFAYQQVNTTATTQAGRRVDNNNNTAGRLVELDPGTGAVTVVGNDNIPGGVATQGYYTNGVRNYNVIFTDRVDALAVERIRAINNGTQPEYQVYYAIHKEIQDGGTVYRARDVFGNETYASYLYQGNPDTGDATRTTTSDPNGIKGPIVPAGVTFAETFLVFSDGNAPTATVWIRSNTAGYGGNGININISRADYPASQPAARVSSVIADPANGTVDINVQLDTNPNATAQQFIDAINSDLQASRYVTAVLLSGSNSEAANPAPANGTTVTTSGGVGVPLRGRITGMAFADVFGNSVLYGVTDRGEFVQIDKNNGRATLIRDFEAEGLLADTNFQGLTIGPQNARKDIAGTPGELANMLFAITASGRLYAFDTDGNLQSVFETGNQMEQLSITGLPSAGDTYTLSLAQPVVGAITTVADVAGVSATETQITFADTASFPATYPFYIRIEDELIRVDGLASGSTFDVTRGMFGTDAADHAFGADIQQVLVTTTDPIPFDAPANGLNETYELWPTSNNPADTYTLTFDPTPGTPGDELTTNPISVTAPYWTVLTELRNLATIGVTDVLVTPALNSTRGGLQIQFVGQYQYTDVSLSVAGDGTLVLKSDGQLGIDTYLTTDIDGDPATGLGPFAPGDIVVSQGDLPADPVNIYFTGAFAGQDVFLTVDDTSMALAEASLTLVSEAGDRLADFYSIYTNVPTGTGGRVTGLAFSPLDFNLWHPTLRRATDPGHGINDPFDHSREPGMHRVEYRGGARTDRTRYDEDQGGASFYFGLEQFVPTNVTNFDLDYYDYQASHAQLGILNTAAHGDLTSNPAIGDNYNLPGGAFGSLVTKPFSLAGYDATDHPTLYFTYWLQTENRNEIDFRGDADDNGMRDSARVLISADGGKTWELLATNNSEKSRTGAISADDGELPEYISHSATSTFRTGINPLRQQVQELFDAAEWRQARVDLARYAGEPNLMLRFDFSTAGDITASAVGVNGAGDAEADLPGDQFGAWRSETRGQNNNFEGFYIDDVIIGFSERGEMVTGAPAGQTGMVTVNVNPHPFAPTEFLTGPYQLEIRRGAEYAANITSLDPEIFIYRLFDTNDRLIFDNRDEPAANDDFEQTDFDNYNILPWQRSSWDPDSFDPVAGSGGIDNPAHFWYVDATNALNGTFSARAGAIPDGTLTEDATTTLSVDVATGSGDVSFNYVISSEEGHDFLRFFIDGQLVLQQSGIVNGGVATDLNTNGAVTVFFGPVGTDPVTLVFSASDHANNDPAPTITVNGQTINIDYNTEFLFSTTADDLVDAINAHPAASGLVTAAILGGDGATDLTTRSINYSPLIVNVDYVAFTTSVSEGQHTFTWTYSKDSGGSAGLDTVVIDDVVFPAKPIGTGDRGDPNFYREQGWIDIQQNRIRDVAQYGIQADAGARDDANGGQKPHPGSPINFSPLNPGNLAPGVTIKNNVVANAGTAGILFSGDPNTGTVPNAVVPYGKIVNNTVYGSTIGIQVTQNASPTVLNNVLANNGTGISVDTSSVSVGTVVERNLFQGNSANGRIGSNPIVNPSGQLFVDPANGNYYPADGSPLVDRSLQAVLDRADFVSFKNTLGIPPSNVIAPERDLYGQLRVDDPSQPPSGLGGEIFYDLGAVERADFDGPFVRLVNPLDNGPDDQDPTATIVRVDNPDLFTQFIIELGDLGIGIDDAKVNANQVALFQEDANGRQLLVEGADYFFAYNANTDQIFLTSVSTFPLDHRYTIVLDNTPDGIEFTPLGVSTGLFNNGIKDLAGNTLQPNRVDGSAQFDILLTNGVNDSPVNTVPQTVQSAVEDTPFVFSVASGNGISVADQDAFLGTNELEVTLTGGRPGDQISLAPASITSDFNTAGAVQIQFTAAQFDSDPITINITKSDHANGDPTPTVTENVAGRTIDIDLNSEAGAETTAADLAAAVNGASTLVTAVVAGGDPAQDIATPAIDYSPLVLDPGLTFPLGDDGVADQTMTFRGLINDINAALDGLVFLPEQDFNTPQMGTNATLTITTNDLGNFPAPASTPDQDVIQIYVAPVNDAPNAVDDVYTVAEGGTLNISDADGTVTPGDATDDGVLVNDQDVDGDPMVATVVAGPSYGTVTLNLDGTFTYTHDGTDVASDSFTYQVSDGTVLSNVATVTINITPVNDAPVLDNTGDMTLAAIDEDIPDAANTGTTVADIIASSAANNGDAITDDDAAIFGPQPEGFAVIGVDDTNGTWQYSIDGGLNWAPFGAVSETNAVLLDENDLIRFVPDPDFNGTVDPGITFRAWDQSTGASGDTGVDTSGPNNGGTTAFSTAIETAAITVNPVNDAPVGNDDAYTTDEDTPLTVAAVGVLGNDADVDGDALSVSAVNGDAANVGTVLTLPSGAELTLNADGSFTYDPSGAFDYLPDGANAVDNVIYTPSDGTVDGTDATVTITITGINDPPTAIDDAYVMDEGTTLIVGDPDGTLTPNDPNDDSVKLNDFDAEGDPMTAILDLAPPFIGGTFTFNADGTFIYQHDGTEPPGQDPQSGQITFTYYLNDGAIDGNIATVTITLNRVNDAPTITVPSPNRTINDNQTVAPFSTT